MINKESKLKLLFRLIKEGHINEEEFITLYDEPTSNPNTGYPGLQTPYVPFSPFSPVYPGIEPQQPTYPNPWYVTTTDFKKS